MLCYVCYSFDCDCDLLDLTGPDQTQRLNWIGLNLTLTLGLDWVELFGWFQMHMFVFFQLRFGSLTLLMLASLWSSGYASFYKHHHGWSLCLTISAFCTSSGLMWMTMTMKLDGTKLSSFRTETWMAEAEDPEFWPDQASQNQDGWLDRLTDPQLTHRGLRVWNWNPHF